MDSLTKRSTHLCLGFLLAVAAGVEAQEFAPSAGFERLRGARAIAVDAESARLAVGTRSSVWLAVRGQAAQRALRAGEVRDLAFAQDGSLWVATDRGLFSLANTIATPHALGPGSSGRATRLLWLGEVLLVGTEDGLALRQPSGAIARVNGSGPAGEVRALAALGRRSALAVVGTEIARVELDASGRFVRGVTREDLPAGGGAAIDLAALGPGEALALREEGLARRDATGAWRRVPLALPPGATPTRLLAREAGLWLATDAGALFARDTSGPFERASAPAGRVPVAALAASAHALFLAGPRGVLDAAEHARLPAAREEASAQVAEASPREPRVLAVQRAALRYLALEPGRIESLRGRVRRSAYAPQLELFGDVGRAHSLQLDWDETFTSGLDRTFFDRQRRRGRDFGAGLRISWSLGGAVYHPEEIDASREAREWLELRDEVLVEVSQLYFERRRALLDAAREADPHAAARLALRAAELAAGLDAWTGGWWSAQLETSSPQRPASEITP